VGHDFVLWIVVATALAFDFTNGFHDTANVVATSISTRAMGPRIAVGYAAVLNFAGAFLSLAVAATIAKGIVEADVITPLIIFGGLIGAISWNLITWYFGLPSSSSHALIGGVVGSAFVAAGPDAILGDGILSKVVIPGLVAPILALVVASLAIVIVYKVVGRLRPGPVSRGFKAGLVAGDGFSKLLATGLTAVFALQVFVIVGGVTKVIPLTGVTLPFVSYGGSSIVANMVLLALLLIVSDHARKDRGRMGQGGLV